MGLWPIFAAMTVLALALVLLPLFRRSQANAARRDYDLRVYRAQLEELEREQERGLLGPEEAKAARLEVERRMLAADAQGRESQTVGESGLRWATAIALLIALPALSVGIYWQLGRPDLPAMPITARSGEPAVAGQGGETGLPPVETMIARLEERVASDPDDVEGWFRLGRAYALTGQFERAADAYSKAVALRGDIAPLHAALGEVLVMGAQGIVTEPARAAFERALELDPTEPRAQFFTGLAALQRGEREKALETWVALIGHSPPNAPWLPQLRERVAALAEELGRDPAALLPPPEEQVAAAPPGAQGPTADQMRAAGEMSAEERNDMIRSMVENLAARLEKQPEDPQGWRMLGRSWSVLGEPRKAADAYARLAGLLPEDAAAQLEYAEALLALETDGQPLSDAVVTQMGRVLALDEDNPDALYFLGRAAREKGDTEAAAQYWQRLLTQLPPDSPRHAQLRELLDNLPAAD